MRRQDHSYECDRALPEKAFTSRGRGGGALPENPVISSARIVTILQFELVDLAREIDWWGANNKYPSLARYPQYPRLREIGQALFDHGGYNAMGQSLALIDEVPELNEACVARLIEFGWNGIAEWQA